MNSPAAAGRAVTRRLVVMLASFILATLATSAAGLLWRADLALYDASLRGAPAPADILIIAIDDRSLSLLGRWPWRRSQHAALLQRLRAAGATAVALDIILTEPDLIHPDDDFALAEALRQGPPAVLPLLVDLSDPSRAIKPQLPVAALARNAAAIGHVNLEIDRDGIARSVFLREGPGSPTWPHLMVALLQSVPGSTVRLFGARHPDPGGADPQAWVRDYQILIPFLGPPGHFQHVSYADVLSGAVSPAVLRNKLVLVGATAQGLSDSYPTPLSGYSRAMPGVEISANILQALRTGTLIRRVRGPLAAVLACIPLLLAGIAFHWLTPRQSLLWVASLWLATAAASWLALRYALWWWPPATALAALALLYPLWSWWRLSTTQRYLEVEFARLNAEPLPLLGSLTPPQQPSAFGDIIHRRIELLQQASARTRELRRLLQVTVHSLPDATVVADPAGHIVLANAAAARLFAANSASALESLSFNDCMEQTRPLPALTFEQLSAAGPLLAEVRLGSRSADLLVRALPFLAHDQRRLGTLISLVDISDLRAAQREREDVVRFLSHDLKSPASSLLGLAQLQRDPARALPPEELSRRLDALAHRTLDLLNGFIALAQAESADPTAFALLDLRDAVQDAVDEVWAAAEARGIAVQTQLQRQPVPVRGDRQLLARAVSNLLNNAVKYSPEGTAVRLTCDRAGADARVTVADEGPGIDPETQARLFERFFRGPHAGAGAPTGAGLGLALVRAVAEKHQGAARFSRRETRGSQFVLSIPLAAALPAAEEQPL